MDTYMDILAFFAVWRDEENKLSADIVIVRPAGIDPATCGIVAWLGKNCPILYRFPAFILEFEKVKSFYLLQLFLFATVFLVPSRAQNKHSDTNRNFDSVLISTCSSTVASPKTIKFL